MTAYPVGMYRFLTNLAAVLLIAIASAGIALLSINPLGRLGLFGTCFEGACGYVAVFAYWPLATMVLTVIGSLAWFVWRRRP